MAWEWVPAVSAATSTTIVVSVTLWAASRTGRDGRRHAEQLLAESNRHAEQIAADERMHKRLEEAYVELLQVLGRAGHWADRLYPLLDSDPPEPLPDLPGTDEQVRVRALVNAYGSDKVKELLDEFNDCIHELLLAQRIIVDSQARGRRGREETEYRAKIIRELRPAQTEKHREIAEQVATELRGR